MTDRILSIGQRVVFNGGGIYGHLTGQEGRIYMADYARFEYKVLFDNGERPLLAGRYLEPVSNLGSWQVIETFCRWIPKKLTKLELTALKLKIATKTL